MTQVKEVSSKGLKREFAITVSADDLEKSFTQRLTKVGKNAKIQGFRPGKAPLHIIKQRYGASVRAEMLEEVVSDNTQKVFEERKLRPAMKPKIEVVNSDEGKDLEFKMSVEILPEIKLADFSKLSLERPVVDVDPAKVEEVIVGAAKRMRQPELVAEARAAKKGDVVIIDFDGSVDGERKPGMKADGHNLELGSKSFIDTFEDQIVGMKAGDNKDIKVKFPDDYHATDIAGKKAVFAVNLKEIRAHKPVNMDDDLAKELGFKKIDDLKKRVEEDISIDYVRAGRSVIKRKLLDQLADGHKFDIPESLVEGEFNNIWAQVQQSKKRGELPADEMKKSDKVLEKEYREIAERRIKLGLILAEISNQQKINATGPEMRDAMMAEARRYPGQEKAVMEYFTKTPGALERLRAPIIEEKTIDYLISQAKVTDKKMSVDELLKLQEDDE